MNITLGQLLSLQNGLTELQTKTFYLAEARKIVKLTKLYNEKQNEYIESLKIICTNMNLPQDNAGNFQLGAMTEIQRTEFDSALADIHAESITLDIGDGLEISNIEITPIGLASLLPVLKVVSTP